MSYAKDAVPGYLKEGLLALIPVYADGGNACRIYTAGREHQDNHTLRWILSQITSYYGTSIKLLHQLYGPVLNRSNTIPLPLSRETLLLPLKMREPRVSGDSTIGYLNGRSISRVEPAPPPHRSAICFREGLILKSYTSPATVRERLLQGDTVYREFLRRQNEFTPASPTPGPSPFPEGDAAGQTEDEFFAYALKTFLRRLTETFYLEL